MYAAPEFSLDLAGKAFEERKDSATNTEKKKETVRKFFPETWIWDLIPVG